MKPPSQHPPGGPFVQKDVAAAAVASPTVTRNSGSIMYSCLLLYNAIFYMQIAARIPALEPLRPEFIVGSVLVLASFWKILSGETDFKENKLNYLAFLFLLYALFTLPFAYVRSKALFTLIRMFKFFSIYLMIITAIDSEKKLKGFVYLYIGLISLIFLQPFLLSLQGKGFIYNNHMWRLAGTTGYFHHPNQLGGMTSANLPFLYYFMRYHRSKAVKILLFVLLVIALRVVMLTQSRTGFLGVMVFFFIVWLTSKRKLLSSLAVILVCILLWNVASQQTKDRFATFASIGKILEEERSDFNEEEQLRLGSMNSRLELMKRSLIVFSENPLIGVGLNCFSSVNGHRWRQWFPPHNTYLQALAEMGIIGFGIFCSVIVLTLKNLLMSKKILESSRQEGNFLTCLATTVTVYLVVRIVVSTFGIELYDNYWWLAAGLSLVILRIVKQQVDANVGAMVVSKSP